MYKEKMVSSILVLLLAAGSLFVGSSVLASQNTKNIGEKMESMDGKDQVSIEVRNRTQQEASQKRDSIIVEAVTALEHTQKAIDALKQKKKLEALDALAIITGKLDIVIAREPDMANAPIAVRVEEFDLYATPEDVKKAVKLAKGLLGDGEVQQARAILGNLVSEVNITVTSLPLKAYADGIKAVAELVDDEKFTLAENALYDLLSTTVISNHTLPLPILRAEELIKKAEVLAETEGRSDDQNRELTALLDNAVVQLDMAEALGYGNKKDYKTFKRHIKEIRDKTKDGKFGKGFMDKLKGALKEAKETIFGNSNNAAN